MSGMKPLQSTLQLGLWASSCWWCATLLVACHVDTCQLLQGPTFLQHSVQWPWSVQMQFISDQHHQGSLNPGYRITVLWSRDQGLRSRVLSRPVFQGLGLEADVLARDQDLIQWQGCTYLPFLNWPLFTSGVSAQFICAKLAAALMPANSDMTWVGINKYVSMLA